MHGQMEHAKGGIAQQDRELRESVQILQLSRVSTKRSQKDTVVMTQALAEVHVDAERQSQQCNAMDEQHQTLLQRLPCWR